MRVFLGALGSLGDVNPMIELGRELRRRGHEVHVLVAGDAEHKVRDSGLEACCVLGQREWDVWRTMEREDDGDMENVKAFLHVALPAAAESIRVLWQRHVPGRTLALAPALSAVGFPFLREKFRMPLLEIQYAPRDHTDGGQFDTIFGPVLDEMRSSIGLAPMGSGHLDWLLTHDRSIGLYPDWFLHAPGAPDMPGVIPTHYLFERSDDARPLPAEVEHFLAGGEPPVVVTFGSYASTDAALYRAAIDAASRCGLRLLILSKYAEQLPSPLPGHCLRVPYVSLQRLLPRVRAFIHHGGAGTVAQSFRAGIPQLVLPMAFDQFINADRVAALGCGRRLQRADFRAEPLSAALDSLISDLDIATAVGTVKARFDAAGAVPARVCTLIERLAGQMGVADARPVAVAPTVA